MENTNIGSPSESCGGVGELELEMSKADSADSFRMLADATYDLLQEAEESKSTEASKQIALKLGTFLVEKLDLVGEDQEAMERLTEIAIALMGLLMGHQRFDEGAEVGLKVVEAYAQVVDVDTELFATASLCLATVKFNQAIAARMGLMEERTQLCLMQADLLVGNAIETYEAVKPDHEKLDFARELAKRIAEERDEADFGEHDDGEEDDAPEGVYFLPESNRLPLYYESRN